MTREKNSRKYLELPVIIEELLVFLFYINEYLLRNFSGLQPLVLFLLAEVKSDTDTILGAMLTWPSSKLASTVSCTWTLTKVLLVIFQL